VSEVSSTVTPFATGSPSAEPQLELASVDMSHTDLNYTALSETEIALSETEIALNETEIVSADLGDVTISTEKLPSRQRRILATIAIAQPLEQVWQILTDYEQLADFIPNLTVSRKVDHPSGGIRLEQIGAQCFLNIKFCARVILDMHEVFPKEVGFSMVEGDFKKFMGAWHLKPAICDGKSATLLCYELLIQPPAVMPTGLIERHICSGLVQNLQAIRQRTMEAFA
jgi:ribosome-associated toxin RatA of RatAB toxin-antitoxin module